jgi:hypothetical protein
LSLSRGRAGSGCPGTYSPQGLLDDTAGPGHHSPFALGDELVFHDQLYANGKRVGDDLGSCVIASLAPQLLANCSLVIRLPGGNLTGQFIAIQGPAAREIALTGGTGRYRSAGGEGTLVEFGNGTGRMTLQVLSLVPRGKGA